MRGLNTNMEIRETAAKKDVKLWQIADRFGVTDMTFSRWLRHEFSEEKKAKALEYINIIEAERKAEKTAGV